MVEDDDPVPMAGAVASKHPHVVLLAAVVDTCTSGRGGGDRGCDREVRDNKRVDNNTRQMRRHSHQN